MISVEYANAYSEVLEILKYIIDFNFKGDASWEMCCLI